MNHPLYQVKVKSNFKENFHIKREKINAVYSDSEKSWVRLK